MKKEDLKREYYRVWGVEGHRQRASFGKSVLLETADAIVFVACADVTGTNDFCGLTVFSFSGTPDKTVEGQITDGVFENCRVGRVEKMIDGEFVEIDLWEDCK